jgi:hypothetical protein
MPGASPECPLHLAVRWTADAYKVTAEHKQGDDAAHVMTSSKHTAGTHTRWTEQ